MSREEVTQVTERSLVSRIFLYTKRFCLVMYDQDAFGGAPYDTQRIPKQTSL